jgi:hypothetical protein
MRADDIRKSSEFEQLCVQTSLERKEEEKLCDHFINASRQRYQTIASRLEEKYLSTMINNKIDYLNSSRPFWKLDLWEDDLRRRRRLIRNSNGIIYDGEIKKVISTNDDMMAVVFKDEYLLKQLKQQKTQHFLQTNNDEDDLSQVDEKDLDQDFSGPIRYATECWLICGTNTIRGTLAITHNALLFDTNEEDENFQKLDSKVRY